MKHIILAAIILFSVNAHAVTPGLYVCDNWDRCSPIRLIDATGNVTDILIDNTLDSSTDLTWHGVETMVYDQWGMSRATWTADIWGRIVGLSPQLVSPPMVPQPETVPEPSVLALTAFGLILTIGRKEL